MSTTKTTAPTKVKSALKDKLLVPEAALALGAVIARVAR
jgi:hypothetical protein